MDADKPYEKLKKALKADINEDAWEELYSTISHPFPFGVSYFVSFLSKSFTLFPGDIISTGTPGGVGYHKKPQLFLTPGDVVQVEIERIGILSNPVG